MKVVFIFNVLVTLFYLSPAWAAYGSSNPPAQSLIVEDPVVLEKRIILQNAIGSLEAHKKKLLQQQENYFTQLQQSSHANMNLTATTSLSFAIRATEKRINELKKMLDALGGRPEVKLGGDQEVYKGPSIDKA